MSATPPTSYFEGVSWWIARPGRGGSHAVAVDRTPGPSPAASEDNDHTRCTISVIAVAVFVVVVFDGGVGVGEVGGFEPQWQLGVMGASGRVAKLGAGSEKNNEEAKKKK